MIVARKEIRESRLWLRLISGRYVSPEDIENDIKESTELLNILSTIIKKLS
jgi:four helix bundle protein